MNREFFEKTTRLNEILLEQFGKASKLQMDTFHRYADVTVEQAQKVSEVRDLEGLKCLAGDQAETLKSLGEGFTADWKAWQDYFSESRQKIQQVFDKSPEEKTEPAAKASK
ncbi:phasin family protein [Marinobacter sp. F3R08]|uniref:phasin family protein n=1 Tax=Marinobacter sp. F3R08 TaxID=2841559 RepID=UPI001C09919E|nr:phasin family protein [Marinobacter sp. F3R08]MBU2955432.1 phasin family protein [Marinobacter sp. F3R08]